MALRETVITSVTAQDGRVFTIQGSSEVWWVFHPGGATEPMRFLRNDGMLLSVTERSPDQPGGYQQSDCYWPTNAAAAEAARSYGQPPEDW